MKKSIKLLVVLLSVALIVCAIAAVSSAATPEQKDNVVSVTTTSGVTAESTFAEAINNAVGGEVITLLGNVTLSSTDAAMINTADGDMITVNLNGYTIDASAKAATGNLFKKDKGGLKITGEGTINIPCKFCNLANSATLIVEGTGSGITVNSSSYNSFVTADSASDITFNNVDINVSFAPTSKSNAKKPFFDYDKATDADGVYVTIKNSTVDIEVNVSGTSLTATENYCLMGIGNLCYVLENSTIRTSGSGMFIDETEKKEQRSVGSPYDVDGDGVADGNYALVMKNSKLVCKPLESVISGSNADAFKCKAFVFEGAGSTSKIYVGNNSYVGATCDLINGFAAATEATSSVTFEESTLELVYVNDSLAGAAVFNGPAYVNFLFGGKLIVGRGALVAEGTSIEGTAQGILGVVNDGNGGEASPKYSVDFAVGAHIDAVPADVVFDYAAAAAFSDYRATYPACGFIVADAEFKEIIKYGPVTIYWYVGNKANYMADAANVVKQTSYFGKLPIAPTSALADIKIGNATLEFAGWSDTYVYYGNYTDYESYLAATEGIIAEIVAITENDIIANGSTRAYFPVYTLKSVSVTHTWVDFLGNTLKTQTVDEGDEAPDFKGAVPTYNTGVVLLTHNGEWDVFATAESVTYVPCYETKVSVDTSGSTVSMSYSNDFSLKLTLTETVYSVLSENDKARFEKAGSVYTVSVDRDLNQMFTPAKFNFTVESEGYTASVSFSTSVYDYTAELLENAEQAPEARKAAYYVLAYMKAAYEYFDVKDNYNYDFSILTEYRDVVSESDFTIPENTTDHSALSGKFYVALILTSRHNTVIGVTNPEYAGKVKVNGVEMELTDGEVVLEAMNENITGTLILELDENGDEVYEVNGTYCILDYQAGLANTEAAEVVNALVNFAYYINTLG